MWYEIVKNYAHYYTPEQMKVFVRAGWITPKQYEELTSTVYEP